MTILAGAILMLFCGVVGYFGDMEHGGELGVALAFLLLLFAAVCIELEGEK